MRFRMLGQLEVTEGDLEVPIRGVKQRALLLLLLVRTGETVPADRLADELWGDAPPAGGANALQALVSKLRRSLGPLSATVATVTGGYRLEAEDDDVDARRFAVLVDAARSALRAGDATGAVAGLDEALALWRGPALIGMDDHAVLRAEATRLEELRWSALEDRIGATLGLGRHQELVGEIEGLIASAPLRERLHGFLLLALYRSGRQAEALRAFQTARTVLGEELGLEPGPELRALESAILAQDPSLDLAAVVPGPVRRRTNLTPALSSFVGRDDHLADLGAVVAERRLVTVVGPGGAGKTRLAQEVAMRRRDDADAWLVELAAVGDPADVADAVVTALRIADDAPAGPAVDRVADHIGDRPTLLVLDNCEHVIAEAARVAQHLLGHCTGLRVLATSREGLGLAGEALWAVPPMARADAVALFVDRAVAVGGLAPSDALPAAIEEVCTRLDGLPLAIELAAARTRAIPVEQLSTRLDDRFRLLTGGTRTAMPRQQTLRAVVEWSYDLLFADEQAVFDRLAVFAGGCSLDAAEAVCTGDRIDRGEVADILARLVDKSLVIADRSAGTARFTLLQTLHLFARERLAEDEQEAAAARRRHAAHYGALCARGPAAFRGLDQPAWLAEVHREADNVRAALAWLIEAEDAEAALALAGGLGWSFWLASGGEGGVRLLEMALECPGPASASARALATTWAFAVGANAGTGLDEAAALGETALDLWREAGEAEGLRDASALLAGVHNMRADRPRALAMFEETAALYAPFHDHWSEAVRCSCAGRAASMQGDLAAAAVLQRDCVEHFEAAGVTWALASVYSDVAIVAEMQGDHDGAVQATTKALDAARRLGFGLAEVNLLTRLGNLALTDGDPAEAEAWHDEALARGEELGARVGLAFASNWRAISRRRAGDLDAAAAWAAAALTTYRVVGAPIGLALALTNLGFVAERRGALDDAVRLHQEALDVVEQHDGHTEALALEGLAGVAVARGDAAAGAALLGRAAAVRASAGGTWSGAPPESDRIGLAATAVLGDEGFADAYDRGVGATTAALLPDRTTPAA